MWAISEERGDVLSAALPDLMAAETCGHLMRREGVEEFVVHRSGVIWRSDIGDAIGIGVLRDGGYQEADVRDVISWLKRSSRTGSTIIDVGANIGTTTVAFGRRGYKVVAIEPVPRTFEMLASNVSANDLSDAVILVQSAVSVEYGKISMSTGSGSGQSEVVAQGLTDHPIVEVPTAPLAGILRDQKIDLAEIAIVWADIQGSEGRLLESGAQLWSCGIPVYLEVDPMRLDRVGGLDQFIVQVHKHFATFLPRGSLDSKPREVAEFTSWVSSLQGTYSDALLIPKQLSSLKAGESLS